VLRAVCGRNRVGAVDCKSNIFIFTAAIKKEQRMQKKRVTVLGAGLVGGAIARDLHGEFEVTAADMSHEALRRLKRDHGIKTVRGDLGDPRILSSVIQDADIIVGALPGSMGYKMIEVLAPEKKDIVDISFFPEDPFTLNKLIEKNGITVVTDCGVAPGMGNIILGYHNRRMAVSKYRCYVGGLPVLREWPWEYKAVFSPIDVIEEYIRPARYVENGHTVVREALSDPELLQFEGIGTLEAWNSDGLRTLIKTMHIPDMIEKTLRYPGCIEYLRVLREAGYFSYDEVSVKGVKIRPIDVTAALLFPKWKLKPGEEDFTIMKIIVEGNNGKGGERVVRHEWDLYDRYDKETDTISMARTTGYTCTAAVHLIARGMFTRKGICPPEYLGEDEDNFRFILDHLKARGVEYRLTSD
jgi:lysine 6-dehydrogenase